MFSHPPFAAQVHEIFTRFFETRQICFPYSFLFSTNVLTSALQSYSSHLALL